MEEEPRALPDQPSTSHLTSPETSPQKGSTEHQTPSESFLSMEQIHRRALEKGGIHQGSH